MKKIMYEIDEYLKTNAVNTDEIKILIELKPKNKNSKLIAEWTFTEDEND